MRAQYGDFRSALRFWHTQRNGITFFRREKASLTLVSKEWHKCWVNIKTSNKNAIMEEATQSMELYYWVPAWLCHCSWGQHWSSLDRLSQMQWRWRNYQWAPPDQMLFLLVNQSPRLGLRRRGTNMFLLKYLWKPGSQAFWVGFKPGIGRVL